MRIVVTGMMAGLNTDEYIQRVVEYGKERNVDIKVYDVFDRILKEHNTEITHLLMMNDLYFKEIRKNAILKIALELERENVEHAIIKTHATAEWNSVGQDFRDTNSIKELRPNMIVTLIDAEWLVEKRIMDPKNEMDSIFKPQFEKYPNKMEKVLDWMNREVSQSEDWARNMSKDWDDFIPDYVLATGQPPESLFKFLTIKDVPVFYSSYSMTHADEKVRTIVNTGIEQLRQFGVVIDPQAIEIGLDIEPGIDKDATYAYTVQRDLRYIVRKLRQNKKWNAVVAFHPYEENPPFSSGMCDELSTARDYGTKRFVVMPKGNSPFTTDSYASPQCLFDSIEELFSFMEHEGYKNLCK